MVNQIETESVASAASAARARLAGLAHVLQVASVVLLLALAALASYLVISGADFRSLAAIGLPGITLIMFLSSATVFLPAPGIAAVGLAGLAWHPLLVGIFAAVGAAIGELVGYLLGYGGRKMLERHKTTWWLTRGEYVMRRWGFLTILVVALIPNPFMDAVGILAGSLRYPARKFLLAVLLGNTVKYTVTAAFGVWTLTNWLLPAAGLAQ